MSSPRAPSNATSAPSGSASTSCCSPSTRATTPTRRTAASRPRPAAACSTRMVTLTYLAAAHLDRAARHRHAAPPPAQPGLRRQGGVDARLALGRPRRPRHRRRLAEGGVRRAQHALAAAGASAPTSTSRCCARSGSTTCPRSRARPTSSPPCEMFPKPLQDPHPPIHIGGETPAALRRAARHGQGWHTFNRSPAQLAEGLAELDTHPRGRRAQPRRPAHHGLPVLQPADPRRRRGLRRGRRRRGGGAVLRLHPRRRGPGLRRPRALPRDG